MDTLAHLLWTLIVFYNIKDWKKALFLGVAPDLFSWTIYMIYRIVTIGFVSQGAPVLGMIPDWAFLLYGITHSFIIYGLVIGTIYLLIKRIPTYVWAYGMHIIMDIPTHSREYLPTPFLFPISNWVFPGFSWGQSWFMITNYTLIITLLIIRINSKPKKIIKELI